MDRFSVIKLSGEGHFGKVYKVRKIGGVDHNKIYAIKRMSMSRSLNNSNYLQTIKNEKQALEAAKGHPFLAQMQYAFVTADYVNIVLDYAAGKDLGTRLGMMKRFTLDEARLCAAEVLLALRFLHERRICYRDLKTENVLIDAHGHMVLCDFGLAVKIEGSELLRRTCGTFEYMAPEILMGTGYRFEVDFWALGVLFFELLTGYLPFTRNDDDDDPESLKQSILNDAPDMIRVKYVTDDASVADVIESLLTKEVETRLGNGGNGPEIIGNHQCFRDIDWGKLKNKGYKVLNMPEGHSDLDDEEDDQKPCQTIQMNRNQSSYEFWRGLEGFSYKAPELIHGENTNPTNRQSSESSVSTDIDVLKIDNKCGSFHGFDEVPDDPYNIRYEYRGYNQFVSLYDTGLDCYIEIKKTKLKKCLVRVKKGCQPSIESTDGVNTGERSSNTLNRPKRRKLQKNEADSVRRSGRLRQKPGIFKSKV